MKAMRKIKQAARRYQRSAPSNNYDRNNARPLNNNRQDRRFAPPSRNRPNDDNRTLHLGAVGKPANSFESKGRIPKERHCESPESTSSNKKIDATTFVQLCTGTNMVEYPENQTAKEKEVHRKITRSTQESDSNSEGDLS